MSTMDRIRTAVIGTGFMGRVHLEALRRVENVDVVEIAGTSLDKAQAAAAGYNVLNATGDWRDVIADPSIDAVHITTPNVSHFPIARAAFEAGKHVLCEKPLALTAFEADAMIHAARKAGTFLGEAFMYRLHPQTAKLVDIVKSGAIGEVRMIGLDLSQFDDLARFSALRAWRALRHGGDCTVPRPR